MSKTFGYLSWLKYSLVAAVLYCIPMLIFVLGTSYTQAWLLYVGNALFLGVVVVFMLAFNRERRANASTVAMLVAGHVVTVAGILIACLIAFIIMVTLVPGFLEAGTAGRVLTDEPDMMVKGKTNGLNFMVLMNAIVGNVSMGSFASIMFAFTPQRDQTKESTAPQEQAV